VRGIYCIAEETALILAALQTTYAPMTTIERCIPQLLLWQRSPDDWEMLVNQRSEVMGLRQVPPSVARDLYIQYLRELPLYGSALFSAEDITVAINIHGIHVLDLTQKEMRFSISFTQILKWEFTASTFLVCVDKNFVDLPNQSLVVQSRQVLPFPVAWARGVKFVPLVPAKAATTRRNLHAASVLCANFVMLLFWLQIGLWNKVLSLAAQHCIYTKVFIFWPYYFSSGSRYGLFVWKVFLYFKTCSFW
jgi:hypothetical protein